MGSPTSAHFGGNPRKLRKQPRMAPPVRDPDILHGKNRKGRGNERYYLGSGAPRKLISFSNMTTKGVQSFLRKQGYNIAKDGIRGPQTEAAIKAWRNKVNAAVFNRRSRGSASGPSNPNQLGGGGGGAGGGGAGGGGAGGGGGGAARRGGGGGANYLEDLINPEKYARGSVEAEYGPMLGQMQRDISLQRKQGGQNLADLASWFQQLEGTRAQGATANQAAQQAAQGEYNQANLGITNALGGAANTGGAAAAGYASAALAGITGVGQAQGNFDRNMAAILASQGVDARRGEMGRQSQIMQELMGKRQDMFKAKGSALAKALAEAQILRTQQRGQNIEQNISLRQLGLQEQESGLKMALGRQELRQGKQNQKMSMAERQLAFDTNMAQYQDFLDQMRESKGGNINFNELDEQSRLGLANSIRTMAMDPGGQNMNQAWKRIRNGLAMAGYNVNDPVIKRYGLSILRTMPGWKHWKKKKR